MRLKELAVRMQRARVDAAGVTDSAAPGATAANETPDDSETASGEPATTDDDATAPERKAAG